MAHILASQNRAFFEVRLVVERDDLHHFPRLTPWFRACSPVLAPVDCGANLDPAAQ